MRVYLAGPEVFLADGRDAIAAKRAIVTAAGLTPLSPGDLDALAGAADLGLAISGRDEELMEAADACIANLTPFRGVSADPGTVFEVGFLGGLGKPVWGYTNDPRDYGVRVQAAMDAAGSAHPLVERHGFADNLMIEGGIARRGGRLLRASVAPADPARDLETFRRVVALVAAARP